MPVFKAVLFDLDGTLIDSECFYFECWNMLLQPYGVQLTFEDWMNNYIGSSLPANAKILKEKYLLPIELDVLIQNRLDASVRRFENEDVPLMPYTLELLDFLQQNHIPMAIVTSSLRADVDAIFNRNGLGSYFKFMITRNDVTNGKPDPEGYNRVCERLGFEKSDCLVIEDTVTGLRAAKSAGMTCYVVQSDAALHQQFSQADQIFYELNEVKLYMERNGLVDNK